jgi:hypothetical protein
MASRCGVAPWPLLTKAHVPGKSPAAEAGVSGHGTDR